MTLPLSKVTLSYPPIDPGLVTSVFTNKIKENNSIKIWLMITSSITIFKF